jgi:hypothetical protein
VAYAEGHAASFISAPDPQLSVIAQVACYFLHRRAPGQTE